ncbi:SPOR domain-containing protein [Lichenifustis flavocetrariae]|uniref:SPOR domain-containing protein n=1 Tax=Lichenifustis flavocetrariae TaxID=2949735 RepID=A0AA41YYB0_9HYPH|nr:SPOR domain-containing protein [Lichenifustis flavocetrariae]MCW6510821.1 SPOR domain-containing protein [Lichenifustis flavocetrariae]
MSEPFLKSRPGAGGYDVQGEKAGYGVPREDPLAELARLVGKDDPFRAGAARAPAANVSPFPQLGAPHHPEHPEEESYEPHPDDVFGDNQETAYPDFDAQLRGSLDTRHGEDLRQRDSLRFPPVPASHDAFDPGHSYPAGATRGDAPPLNADLWAEGALPQDSMQPGPFDGPVRNSEGEEQRSPRRTVLVLAAVLLLTGGGLGATFLMRESSAVGGGSSSTPTIMASDTPVKVQSPDVTNGASPDGNTALLEKSGSDKVDNAKVVTKIEQPVDLNQLPKPATSPAASAPSQAASPPNPFPEPRKVKTVLIRPDGSVVGDAPQTSSPVVPGGVVMPAAADLGTAQPQADMAAPPPAPVAKPSTPKSTARVSSTPKDPNGGASGAKQAAAPAHVAKPKPPVAVADASAPAETTPAATPGSWSVQLAAPPSEQEAKDVAARLQKKFASELGGQKPSIHKADRDGKSIYRVRIGGQSQDDAKALCSKLQASGGSCFVVRN